MTNPDPGFPDLAEAIANALAVQLTTDGIPLWPVRSNENEPNELAQVAHLCLEKTGQHQTAIAIRTSDSQTWYLIPTRLDGFPSHSEPGTFGRQATHDSYKRFLHLNEQANALTSAARSALPDQTAHDMLFQAWYDNLDEDDQQHWDRWTSGGYATKDDWRSIGPAKQ